METSPGVELHMETSEGGLKELVHRWFAETQASLILHNGNFPEWFQGFTARKDAEDLLRDKTLGCFLIRLSDKAIGYILSYKGQDRCRHFVINQNQAGLFMVSGDCLTHHSLPDLIEHYKVSPIQPFGEYLTSCCYQTSSSELYDVVKFESKEKPAVSVRALRSLWDQKSDCSSDQRNDLWNNPRAEQQNDHPTEQPPTLPPKSKNRKLTGTASVDRMSQAEYAASKRGMSLSYSLSESLHEKTSHYSQTQLTHFDQNKVERLASIGNLNRVQTDDGISSHREDPSFFSNTDTSYHMGLKNTSPPAAMYSEVNLMENRSKSLPRLDNNLEEAYSNQLSTPWVTALTSHSPAPLKRVTCHTYSLHEPRESMRHSTKPDHHRGDKLVELNPNPIYQSSDGLEASPSRQEDSMYAEVPQGPMPPSRHLVDNTYEQIPGESAAIQSNTYETLEDLKTKQSKSTWGKSNIKWWKVFPEYKKK